MRIYPTMSFERYIKRFAIETKAGKFWCDMCGQWIDKQRWVHFRKRHRFEETEKQ